MIGLFFVKSRPRSRNGGVGRERGDKRYDEIFNGKDNQRSLRNMILPESLVEGL
jgi:hypothetical protein